MSIYKKFCSLGVKNKFIISLGFIMAPSSYLILSRTDFLNEVVGFVGNKVVNPTFVAISEVFEHGMNRVRGGFFVLGTTFDQWINYSKNNFHIELKKINFLTAFKDGFQKVVYSSKDLLMSLLNFLFRDLPNFINNHSREEVEEYIKHYLRPMKMLFKRPDLDGRLMSAKTRFDQFVNALKNPDFFSTLSSMNNFYWKFKDQINQLSDEQLSELIDVYLEDPVDMKLKVDEVMKHIGNDDKILKEKFDVNLMMDFVRSENIAQIKAKLSATKLTDTLFKILGSEESSVLQKNFEKVIGDTFVSAVGVWNSWFE